MRGQESMSALETVAQPAIRRVGVSLQTTWVWCAIVAGTLVLWRLALTTVDIAQMNDYGLVSVMNPLGFIALGMLTVSFCIALRNPVVPQSILLIHVIALIVMLFGVTSIVEQVPRFESTWKHVGVADYVIRHGSVDPQLDAYFNWPGFFILLAFLTEVTGASSPLAFANWTPTILELMYLPAILVIFRRGTEDRRLVWLSVWVFYLANWIGQDYLSPQGLNYLLYLVIIAIVITWLGSTTEKLHPIYWFVRFKRQPWRWINRFGDWIAPPDFPPEPTTLFQRVWMLSCLAILFVTITIGHQLTPYAVIGGIGLLAICNRIRYFILPVAMAIIAGLWLRFGAYVYWAGHASQITEQIGALDQAVGSNVSDRMAGSRGHEIVVYLRTGMTVALWGLAGLGGLRRLFAGHRDFSFALLALAPFPLVAAQSYGGEMLLRVYLFALPFMAFFVAGIFYARSDRGHSWMTTGLVIAFCLVAASLFFVTRYGNERQDYFTPSEVAAADFLYDTAPDGSLILAGTVKAPWKYRNYELHKHLALSEMIDDVANDDGSIDLYTVTDLLADPKYNGGYFFVTRSEIANDELFGLIPGGLEQLMDQIRASPNFEMIYESDDAWIFTLAPEQEAP
jgi:hypothetical protein